MSMLNYTRPVTTEAVENELKTLQNKNIYKNNWGFNISIAADKDENLTIKLKWFQVNIYMHVHEHTYKDLRYQQTLFLNFKLKQFTHWNLLYMYI